MSTTHKSLRVGEIRTRKIVAHTLQIKEGRHHSHHSSRHLLEKIRELRQRVSDLEHTVHDLRKHAQEDRRHLEHQIQVLQAQVRKLEQQIASGQPDNPALQSLFKSKQGQTVTVSTASGTLSGTVTLVGTNAVELTESNGDIVIIPYDKITAVQ